MAEAGAAGGIKLPIATAFQLAKDTTKMLATDAKAGGGIQSKLSTDVESPPPFPPPPLRPPRVA
jgi:hypothetical protein